MASIVQITETRLVSVTEDGGRVVLAFDPACVIKSEGIPSVDASTRWSQLGELVIEGAEIEAAMDGLPAVLTGGRIQYGGYTYVDMIPVPLQDEPAAYVRFEAGDRVIEVRGERMTLELIGDGSYIEHIEA